LIAYRWVVIKRIKIAAKKGFLKPTGRVPIASFTVVTEIRTNPIGHVVIGHAERIVKDKHDIGFGRTATGVY
jgi:hypothetical protein